MFSRASLLVLIGLFVYKPDAISQSPANDTVYLEDHSTDLTLKTFGGYSFSGYTLGGKYINIPLSYKSNNSFDLGLGFNYRFLALNLSVKAPFINNDNSRYGNTKVIDLQTSYYLKRFTVDLYGQFYRGYYIRNSSILAAQPPQNIYITRPDLKTNAVGVNFDYTFNYKRFSYRAAYMQNEYQRKSAGSFIAGFGLHHFSTSANAPLIPSYLVENGFFDNKQFNKSQVFCASANGGYAQTVVIRDHYFLTGALVGGIGFNITSLTDDMLNTKDRKAGLQYNGTIRVAAGYNSKKYFAGVQYINFITRDITPVPDTWQQFQSGYLRVTVATRFSVRKNVIKNVVDNTMLKDAVDKTMLKDAVDKTIGK